MTSIITNSFSAELLRIGKNLRDAAVWPSPGTGLALQVLKLCGCGERRNALLGPTPFPEGLLDTAPAAATAGFAMTLAVPRSEELARWQEGMERLTRRDPFPRDRQTFAYRPTELVGLTAGIVATEDRSGSASTWIRTVIQDLPGKSPPTTAWALLLYHYAASMLNLQFRISIPARLHEYDTTELGLLAALSVEGKIFKEPDFNAATVQNTLLERILTECPIVREAERLSVLYGALFLSLKDRVSTLATADASALANLGVVHPPTTNPVKQKILFLAANPTNETRLSLDKECREIESKIRLSEYGSNLELLTKWAVRPNDLLQYLHQHSPHIVHFSGHGSDAEELIFLDSHDEAKPVSKEALRQLFAALKDNIRVVVLNACFSRPQAEAITEVVECAVGMNHAIGDEAAITFAAAFYQAIGFGRSIKIAFESGKAALLLEGIAEENVPVLFHRNDVNPSDVVLVRPPSNK